MPVISASAPPSKVCGASPSMFCSDARITDPDEGLDGAPEFSGALAAELRESIFLWERDLTESIKWSNLCFSGRKHRLSNFTGSFTVPST